MCIFTGAGNGIRHDPDMIIMLVRIHRRVMDTDIRQSSDQIQCIYAETFQQNLQIRPKNALYLRLVIRYSPSMG